MRWTNEELRSIGQATELRISSRRRDGTLRPFVTIWGVRVGDDIYVRSAYGPKNGWYRRAIAAGVGRVRAGGVERDVAFERPSDEVHAAIDAAYHAKYDRYGPAIVGTVVGTDVVPTTLVLVPSDEG
ncbi:MAG: DUF2255 family protein [Dermatophilaceae bacterium]